MSEKNPRQMLKRAEDLRIKADKLESKIQDEMDAETPPSQSWLTSTQALIDSLIKEAEELETAHFDRLANILWDSVTKIVAEGFPAGEVSLDILANWETEGIVSGPNEKARILNRAAEIGGKQ